MLLSEEQQSIIVDAIKAAEKETSGEIKVHVEQFCPGDVLERAKVVFGQLELHKTAQRNGVLFYLATVDRKFAILGDKGINDVVPANFWQDIRNDMQSYFVMNQFAAGFAVGIQKSGVALKQFFPYQSDDINEISDEISFGD
ncbi:MAG: TPM domain-containing protein [Flectobacillus sp.]|uniref:TPM domain-containing protein n=1 Tax=Flectobacillus sp. TaxID=50419 RepID=UPI003B9C7556